MTDDELFLIKKSQFDKLYKDRAGYGVLIDRPDLKVGSKAYINEVMKRNGKLDYHYLLKNKYRPTLNELNDKLISNQKALYEKIASGRYVFEQNRRYYENYIDMMKTQHFPNELIKRVQNIGLSQFTAYSGLMPDLRNYYDIIRASGWYKGKRGRKSVSYDEARGAFVDQLNDVLNKLHLNEYKDNNINGEYNQFDLLNDIYKL